jgi:TetR/AcrR family transcriptional regulator, fatty acid metabolism regulator protein
MTSRPKKRKEKNRKPSFIETARRDQIIEVAIQTIAAIGYSQASLAEIAKRAKVSKGIISYYFSGKDELIIQVIRRIFTLGEERMRSYQDAPTAGEKLKKYIELNVAFLRENRKQALALVDILINARDKHGKSLMVPANYEPVVNVLEQLLIEGQNSGEFRKFSPRVMAASVRGAIDAISGQMVTHPDLDLDLYAQELVHLFELATGKARTA